MSQLPPCSRGGTVRAPSAAAFIFASRTEGRLVVLAVEDSPEAAAFLVQALEREGFTVLVAPDGSRAVSIAERVTLDVILVDAVMPGRDGFETTQWIKANERLSDIPVIFMTGLSETEHIVRAFAAGGVDYVTKPIKPEELVARIGVHNQIAKASRGAKQALDTAGRYLFAVDGTGQLLWATPQARRFWRSTICWRRERFPRRRRCSGRACRGRWPPA
ncbi:PleD family two-component system response regulator [Aurantimonas sp. VKM B-3413]|uniref:response regulator n=1 Tax=Aurantimonas sp. VKM B-3413 TaxID=2779401 RepID=UPI00351DA079